MRNFQALQAWESKARDWQDTEGVHQMRVSLRRLRSALRVFRPAVPGQETKHWNNEMRWCANQLGPARDIDVFIDESLLMVADKLDMLGADELRALAEAKRQCDYATVNDLLDSQRYRNFKITFKVWLEQQTWQRSELTPKQRTRLASPIKPFAAKRLQQQTQAVLLQGYKTSRDAPESMHQLRIECKKLRYTAEFFRPLFPLMNRFIKRLKSLQDVLGMMNDVVVMQSLLDELLQDHHESVAAAYASAVIGWRSSEYYALSASFEQRWRRFLKAEQPWT